MLKVSRTREMSFVAWIESPPKRKKLSNTPTSCVPKTSVQILKIISSVGVRGATSSTSRRVREVLSGSGRARLSTLPFGVRGNSSNTTKAEGIM